MEEATNQYRLTPAAKADLRDIWRYTFAHWGVEKADQYFDRLIGAFVNIASDPKLGQQRDWVMPGYRCFQVARHTIWFRRTKADLVVVRILHQRMDAKRHLGGA